MLEKRSVSDCAINSLARKRKQCRDIKSRSPYNFSLDSFVKFVLVYFAETREEKFQVVYTYTAVGLSFFLPFPRFTFLQTSLCHFRNRSFFLFHVKKEKFAQPLTIFFFVSCFFERIIKESVFFAILHKRRESLSPSVLLIRDKRRLTVRRWNTFRKFSTKFVR